MSDSISFQPLVYDLEYYWNIWNALEQVPFLS